MAYFKSLLRQNVTLRSSKCQKGTILEKIETNYIPVPDSKLIKLFLFLIRYDEKIIFRYAKPFSDICLTYDGLVSAILTVRAYGPDGFFYLIPSAY